MKEENKFVITGLERHLEHQREIVKVFTETISSFSAANDILESRIKAVRQLFENDDEG